MIAHVTTSSLASENKTLSHPASVDSLPTSGGQEDLVSMAPWAGHKLVQIQKNVTHILAVELIVAGAANFIASAKMRPGRGTAKVLEVLNEFCAYKKRDRPLSDEIKSIYEILKTGYLNKNILKYLTLE